MVNVALQSEAGQNIQIYVFELISNIGSLWKNICRARKWFFFLILKLFSR